MNYTLETLELLASRTEPIVWPYGRQGSMGDYERYMRRPDPLEGINIQAEAQLIRQKKSALPRMKRDMVMERAERIPKTIDYTEDTDNLTSDIKKAIESDGVILVKTNDELNIPEDVEKRQLQSYKEALDAQA